MSRFFFLLICFCSLSVFASPETEVSFEPEFTIDVTPKELEKMAEEFRDLKQIETRRIQVPGRYSSQDEEALAAYRQVAMRRWGTWIRHSINLRATFFKIRAKLNQRSSKQVKRVIKRGYAKSVRKEFHHLIASFADLSGFDSAMNLCETLTCTQTIREAMLEWNQFATRANRRIPKNNPRRYSFKWQFRQALNSQAIQEVGQSLVHAKSEKRAIRNLALGVYLPYLRSTQEKVNLGEAFIQNTALDRIARLPFSLRAHHRHLFRVSRKAIRRMHIDRNYAITTGQQRPLQHSSYRYSYLIGCESDGANWHGALYGGLNYVTCVVTTRDKKGNISYRSLDARFQMIGAGLYFGWTPIMGMWIVSPVPVDLLSRNSTWVGIKAKGSLMTGGSAGFYMGPHGAVASLLGAGLGIGAAAGVEWFKLEPAAKN